MPRMVSFASRIAQRAAEGKPALTVLQMIELWNKGCSHAPAPNPQGCSACTTGLIHAIHQYEIDHLVCTRSHPHENMSVCCETATIIARANFQKAQPSRLALKHAEMFDCGEYHDRTSMMLGFLNEFLGANDENS